MKKPKKDELLFLPLGGSNEIGMNVNLYHYEGKWLMIDLGAGFADDYYPGIQMIAPDLSFIYERREDFLGIVLTHGHEDHLGSVGYLWDKLRCPIYATPFTAGIAANKLDQAGMKKQAKITIVEPGSKFDIGPFSLEMIGVTHSIPEMNSIVIRTKHGNILHTGDWKFDPDPIVGKVSDKDAYKRIGDEGVLAMMCDSTNIFNDRVKGSEGELRASISKLIADYTESGKRGTVVVTTFASNVARIDTIARAAKDNGRKVILAGLSLHRVTTIARETGYLSDIDDFLSDKEVKNYPKNKLLIICTGCQGEDNAAMKKIASGNHRNISLTSEDLVIFSSKIIPGNEKKIAKLFNLFLRHKIEVFTEKDHFVHVSGHPSREELTEMYELVRPQNLIPIHGEPVHLHEHVAHSKSQNIPNTIQIQNGELIRLAPGEPTAIRHVPFGYLAVDGNCFHPADGDVMKRRRQLQRDGVIFVSLVFSGHAGLAAEPIIKTPGVMDEKENHGLLREISEELIYVIEDQNDLSDDNVYKITRRTLRRIFKEETGKIPPIEITLARV